MFEQSSLVLFQICFAGAEALYPCIHFQKMEIFKSSMNTPTLLESTCPHKKKLLNALAITVCKRWFYRANASALDMASLTLQRPPGQGRWGAIGAFPREAQE